MNADPAGHNAPRPNVLALPSATTARLILLLAAVLSGGAYVGISFHDWLLASSTTHEAVACNQRAASSGLGQSGQLEYLESCLRPEEVLRGLFALGATVLFALLLVAVLLLTQVIIGRRRPGREMAHYFDDSREYLAELRRAGGVSQQTVILVGPPEQRDAFTYGAFGHYRVQVPRGMAAHWRARVLFEPILLHEFAHIFHRDVKWGWFARAAWYAVTPVLLASIVLPALQGDWSYFWSYTWRALLLAVLAQLLIRSYLRARETDADLRAAQILRDTAGITAAISGNVSAKKNRVPLLAFHPTAEKRVDAILDPASTVRIGFTDGFTAALLATLAGGVFLGVARNLLYDLNDTLSLSDIISNGLSQAILGFAVGGGLLRATIVARVTGQPVSATGPALGVGAGVAAGLLASLSQTGTGAFDGTARPWEIVAAVAAGMAATAYAAALARLWSFSTPLATRPRASWVAFCVLATGVFWVLGWVSSRLGDVIEYLRATGLGQTPYNIYIIALAVIPSRTLLAILLVIGLLITGLLLARPRASSPAWLLDDGETVAWGGFARRPRAVIAVIAVAVAGAGGAGAILLFEAPGKPLSDLINLVIGCATLAGLCGSLAASAATARIGSAVLLPAAIASSGLAVCLTAGISGALHLPLDIHQLLSMALLGIPVSVLASVIFVPLVMRVVALVARAT
jgi:Zn-dependent protease with chaperone function